MTRLRLCLAILLAAAAAAAALLAADVASVRDGLRGGDAAYAAGLAPRWRAETRLPFGLTERLLGARDELALRRALEAYGVAARSHPGFDLGASRTRARDEASAALADVAASGPPAYAAQASDLLGILAFQGSRDGRRPASVEHALSALRAAIALDPDDEAAKVNLEIVLRLITPQGARPGARPGGEPRQAGRRGGGAGGAGRGY